MKIFVPQTTDLVCLSSKLQREGHVLSTDVQEVELHIKSAEPLPVTPETVGLQAAESRIHEYSLSKLWVNHSFGEQTILSLPLRGMMNGDLGAQVVCGAASRFVQPTSFVPYFEGNTLLSAFLGEYTQRAWVTLHLVEGKVTDVLVGLPAPSIFGLLEGVRGSIADWLTEPTRLLESWNASLLVSRFPFPASMNESDRVLVSGITEKNQEHFWPYTQKLLDGEFKTTKGVIGFSTAWSQKLHSAVKLCELSAEQIQVPEKQYRTDLERMTLIKFDKVQQLHKIS